MTYHLRLKGFVGGWDFDADYAQYILDKYQGQPVAVCIDSMGGQLNTALSISAAFKAHGDVSVHYVGMNASAATIASLGAKHVSIARDAWYLVHKTSIPMNLFQDLNSDDIEEHVKDLEKAKQQLLKYDMGIAKAYARRCKKETAELYELMKEETFLSAEEALEWGFVDEITDDPADPAPHIDDITLDYCTKNNIRIPDALLPVKVGSRHGATDSGQDNDSFINRIVASVKSAFSKPDSSAPSAPLREEDTTQDTTMTKPENKTAQQTQQPASGTLRDDSGQTAENPTAEQNCQPGLPAELAALRSELASVKDQLAEANARLEKAPAASHSTVIDDNSGAKTAPARACNLSKSARALFNSLP